MTDFFSFINLKNIFSRKYLVKSQILFCILENVYFAVINIINGIGGF